MVTNKECLQNVTDVLIQIIFIFQIIFTFQFSSIISLFLIYSHTKAISNLEEYAESLDTSRLSLCVYSIINVHNHFDFILIC